MATIYTYKDLVVWWWSMELVAAVCELTDKFPKEGIFGILSQMRRASISIPSNIAEGRGRGTKKEFVQFLRMSFGSGWELETQIEIAKRLSKTERLNYREVDALLSGVIRMLQSMIRKLNPSSPKSS